MGLLIVEFYWIRYCKAQQRASKVLSFAGRLQFITLAVFSIHTTTGVLFLLCLLLLLKPERCKSIIRKGEDSDVIGG